MLKKMISVRQGSKVPQSEAYGRQLEVELFCVRTVKWSLENGFSPANSLSDKRPSRDRPNQTRPRPKTKRRPG
jgi:hypothetical protein